MLLCWLRWTSCQGRGCEGGTDADVQARPTISSVAQLFSIGRRRPALMLSCRATNADGAGWLAKHGGTWTSVRTKTAPFRGSRGRSDRRSSNAGSSIFSPVWMNSLPALRWMMDENNAVVTADVARDANKARSLFHIIPVCVLGSPRPTNDQKSERMRLALYERNERCRISFEQRHHHQPALPPHRRWEWGRLLRGRFCAGVVCRAGFFLGVHEFWI